MKSAGWIKITGLLLLAAGISHGLSAQGVTAPAEDTDKITLRADNVFGIDSVKPSLRNNLAVIKDTNSMNRPLAYQYIRPVDAIWGKRVWEEIDVRQKMNLSFTYPGYDAQGNSLTFINILLNAVLSGKVTAFSPVDDRFTTPLTIQQVQQLIHGKPQTIRVVDPITGVESDTTIYNDFNPQSVTFYRLKEDWVFDKQTSVLYCRIIGIAPLQTIYNDDGSVRAHAPMFWLYYPDMRPILAKYEVYNPRNYYQRMTWEDLFAMRYFSAHIVKEDNPFNRSLKEKIPGDSKEAGIKRLLEGREIHNEIFNYEQNLWAY